MSRRMKPFILGAHIQQVLTERNKEHSAIQRGPLFGLGQCCIPNLTATPSSHGPDKDKECSRRTHALSLALLICIQVLRGAEVIVQEPA